MITGRPMPQLSVPASVEEIARGRPLKVVWENEVGGLTFEVGRGQERSFVKWVPTACGIDLRQEALRLAWAVDFTPVPLLMDQGDDDAGEWIVTAPLPGQNAVTERWKADPKTAVTAIGEGLRAMHEDLPVDACPFGWRAEDRVTGARQRAEQGLIGIGRWHQIHRPLGIDRALELVADIPPTDQLVVCHGDSCAPNTLLANDGHWSGHVDLGALGTADRWADLAIATWSTEWNYGPGWEGLLLDAYGTSPDPERSRYYRLLWDLGP